MRPAATRSPLSETRLAVTTTHAYTGGAETGPIGVNFN